MASNIISTVYPMLGGVDASAGVGGKYLLTVGGTWAQGDKFLISLFQSVTSQGVVVGEGTLTGKAPTYLLTYNKKLNTLFATTWAFSAINSPTQFNDPNLLGNGDISLSDAYSEAQDVVAMSPFQGKVAVFGNNHIQIWQVDADPDNYALAQVLENVGAIAKLSVKSLGELDVFFLHTSGIRSLRVRDSSSNGMLVDVGSPIDSLIQSQVISASASQRAAACGVIDMINSQYWLFLKDTIYVLSHFPSAKISAWSTFKPTYQSANLMAFYHETGLDISIKIAMVNDVTKSYYTLAAPANTSNAIVPGKYIFVVDTSTGEVLDSSEITDGLDFRGRIVWDNAPDMFTFTSNQTTFTPDKFVVYNNQVFVSTSEGFYVYGGADRNTYDNAICSFETSWLDFDSPANDKNFHGVDVAQVGSWSHFAGPDFRSETLQPVMLSNANPTFAGGKIGWTNTGTHAKYRMQTDGAATKAVVSNLLIHYKMTNQK